MLYTAGGEGNGMDEWMNAGVGREARPDKVDGGEKETGERLEYYRMNYSVQYPSTTTVE